eukprot:TRINITY_DN66104_c10_g6_i1.p2 TRINITY_DN66104_c10_g6~~TRINITY_DN66104_c10_g6_i1.p2  ORF type:complete len:167 (-),score=53.85 TRINITY_DN66104_c10_g6_i1:23-523(-)
MRACYEVVLQVLRYGKDKNNKGEKYRLNKSDVVHVVKDTVPDDVRQGNLQNKVKINVGEQRVFEVSLHSLLRSKIEFQGQYSRREEKKGYEKRRSIHIGDQLKGFTPSKATVNSVHTSKCEFTVASGMIQVRLDITVYYRHHKAPGKSTKRKNNRTQGRDNKRQRR